MQYISSLKIMCFDHIDINVPNLLHGYNRCVCTPLDPSNNIKKDNTLFQHGFLFIVVNLLEVFTLNNVSSSWIL